MTATHAAARVPETYSDSPHLPRRDLKKPKPKGGGAAKYSADDALEQLKSPMKTAEWQKVCDRKMKMSSATFYRKLT